MKSLYKTWLLALLALTLPQIAVAYQIPTTPNGSWTGTGTTVPATPATKDTPSGLRTTVSLTGAAMTFSARNDVTLMRTNNTTVPLLPTNTNGIQVLATVGGGGCDNALLTCTGLGTMTVAFTDTAGNPISVRNPKLHLSRLGGSVTNGTNTTLITDIFTLTTAGVTLGTPSTGAVNLSVTGGNQVQANLSTLVATGVGACANAGCGTIPVTGTTSQLAFNVSAVRNNTLVNWNNTPTAGDAIFITASFDEDYGDAPATYDASSAASHIISDLALGTNITAENPNTANGGADGLTTVASSPNAVAAGANNNSPNGDGASDDGVFSFPALTTAASGSTYTVPVSLSGASRAGQSCGWIDFNKNGTFDNTTERACASFVSGATSANLTWTVPAGITVGNTYARIRASYDTVGVQNPTGRLNSGEVEDYQLAIAPPPPDLTITKTHSGNFFQGQIGATYTLTATNSGSAATSGTVTVSDTLPDGVVLVGAAGNGWNCTVSGQVVTCTRSDALAAGASYPPITLNVDVGSKAATSITNTATVSGGGEVRTNNNSASDLTTINTVPPPPSICSVTGGILGTNLFADNGSFGRLSGSPAQSTFGGALPSGRTTYNYDINSPTNYASGIDDGEYTIINKPTQATFRTDGAWYLPYDHTEGPSTNGLMMMINANQDPGVFYQERLNVTPNTNYEFSIWIMNILKPQNPGIDPDVAFEVDRIGVDDDNNPATPDGSEGQIITTSGNIPEQSAPNWLNFGTIVNSGAATQIIVRFRNNNPGGGGNDLAIDDLMFAPCTPLPSGNISGTLYGDSNTNGNFDSGEPRVRAGVLVQLVSSSGVISATTQTDAQGNYQFQNIPLGNYTIKVATTDPDLQGATPTSPNNGQLNASLTTQGQNLNNQNFGFAGVPIVATKPILLMVKRITAINGNKTQNPNDNTPLNTFRSDSTSADNDLNWPNPNTYLIGAYNGGKAKPGDELEYTIYFLNKQNPAINVTICDPVPVNMTFVSDGYNSASPRPTESGALPTDTGIALASDAATLPTSPTFYLTNANDDDRGRYYPPNDPSTPNACKRVDAAGSVTATGAAANTDGAIVVNVVSGANQLPPATSSGNPTNSYGYIRFKARVK